MKRFVIISLIVFSATLVSVHTQETTDQEVNPVSKEEEPIKVDKKLEKRKQMEQIFIHFINKYGLVMSVLSLEHPVFQEIEILTLNDIIELKSKVPTLPYDALKEIKMLKMENELDQLEKNLLSEEAYNDFLDTL